MLGFDSNEDEDSLHSVKFVEDVPLIMIVEIGRTDMEIQDILNLKKGNIVATMFPFLRFRMSCISISVRPISTIIISGTSSTNFTECKLSSSSLESKPNISWV